MTKREKVLWSKLQMCNECCWTFTDILSFLVEETLSVLSLLLPPFHSFSLTLLDVISNYSTIIKDVINQRQGINYWTRPIMI